MNLPRFLVGLPLALAFLAGCGGISSPSNNTNDEWSGIVRPETGVTEARHSYTFSVRRNGEMSARLTALEPSAALVGLMFGQVVNGTCGFGNQNNLSGLNKDVMITPIYQSGTYCVEVFNGGGVTVPTSYTLRVNHP